MSFVFSWDKLDDEVALQIEGMIHAHFQRIPKPTFMGNIAVSKFRFGSTPPSVQVLDVTDPLEEWYVHMDQEEARLAQEAADAGGGESLDEDELDSEEDYDAYPFSGDESIVMVGEGDDMEYLESGNFEDDERERLETEEWMQRQSGSTVNGNSRVRSSKAASAASAASESRRQTTYSRGSGSDHDATPQLERHRLSKPAHTTSARASPSSTSSSSSTQSFQPNGISPFPKQQPSDGGYPTSSTNTLSAKRSNRNLKVETNSTLSPSSYPTNFSSPASWPRKAPSKASTIGISLSSHASDEDIESEAFYTHGESTIYQRMKNLVLEPSSILSPKSASIDGDSGEDAAHGRPLGQGVSTQPSTPNTGNGSLHLGAGSSPGLVLSSVMQTRSGRPLSSASFYSTPPSVVSSNTPGGQQAQPPQLYFPDLSGMVVSGNSLLGLGRKPLGAIYSSRPGTPTRTMPGTPRGFESPTLAFSRRQSFSDQSTDDTFAADLARTPPALVREGDRDQDHHNPSAYTSPVEALSFEAFSRPKSVDRNGGMADTMGFGPPSSDFGGEGDLQSRSSSVRQSAQSVASDRRSAMLEKTSRATKRDRHRHRRRAPREPPAAYSLPPMPPRRHENDIQLLLNVNYQGQMGFTVETEMLLNYPTFAFLALPVKLVITGFSFKAKVLMGYLRDHVNVCFLEPEDPNDSILSNVRIESQVGDEQKLAVLKNVGKIERFVVEQLRKFITEDFVYPSYHSIELQRAPPAEA